MKMLSETNLNSDFLNTPLITFIHPVKWLLSRIISFLSFQLAFICKRAFVFQSYSILIWCGSLLKDFRKSASVCGIPFICILTNTLVDVRTFDEVELPYVW